MPNETAREVRARSEELWGRRAQVSLVGSSDAFMEALRLLKRYAVVERPMLITGESGVGKELFARALYLLGSRCGRPFLTVNCAQYQNEELLVSELFGHRKGSFTGAVSDRTGIFEEADCGVLFLDEVGELSARAQAMLLRALSEGEVRALGSTRTRQVDVQLIAATNRPLREMVREGRFREDLYFRLRYLSLRIPPVRDRGGDWRLLLQYYLGLINRKNGRTVTMAHPVWDLLEGHGWPGNVREIRSIVEVGFCLCEDGLIRPSDIDHMLQDRDALRSIEGQRAAADDSQVQSVLARMAEEEASFWDVVRAPFLERELNRREVQEIVRRGLSECGWRYRELLHYFNLSADEYLRFMDFLRHHRLKPPMPHRGPKHAALRAA